MQTLCTSQKIFGLVLTVDGDVVSSNENVPLCKESTYTRVKC